MVNAFIEFVKEYRKKNPSLSYKEALQNASKEYKPSEKVKKTKTDAEKAEDKDKKNTRSRMIRKYKKLLDTVKKQISRGELNKDDYDDLTKVGNQLRGKSTKNSYAKALKDLERKVKTKKFSKLSERAKKKTDKLKSDLEKQKKSNIERQLAKEAESKSKSAMISKKIDKQFDSYIGNLQPNDYLKLFMKKNPTFNKFRAEAYIKKYKTYEKNKQDVPIVKDAEELKLADQPPPKVAQRVVVTLPKLVEDAVNEVLGYFGLDNTTYDLRVPLDINFYDFTVYKTKKKVDSLIRRLNSAIKLLPSKERNEEIFRNRILDIVTSLGDYRDELPTFQAVSSALISAPPVKATPKPALTGKPLEDEKERISKKYDITLTQAERVIENTRVSKMKEDESVKFILSQDTKQEVEQFLDFIESKEISGIKDASTKTAIEFPDTKKVSAIKDFTLTRPRTEKDIAVDIKKAIKAKNALLVEKLFRKQQTEGLKSKTKNALRSRYGKEYDKSLEKWEREVDRIEKLRDTSATRKTLDTKLANAEKVLKKIDEVTLPQAQIKYDEAQAKFASFGGTPSTAKNQAKSRRDRARTKLNNVKTLKTAQEAKVVTAQTDIDNHIRAKNTDIAKKEDDFTDELKKLEAKFFKLIVDAKTKESEAQAKSLTAKPSVELAKARAEASKLSKVSALPELQRREEINRIEAEFESDVPLRNILNELIPILKDQSGFKYSGNPEYEKVYKEVYDDIKSNGIEQSTIDKISADATNEDTYLAEDINILRNADNVRNVVIAKLFPAKYALLQTLLEEGLEKPAIPEGVISTTPKKDETINRLEQVLSDIDREMGNPAKNIPDIILAKQILKEIPDSNPHKSQLERELNELEARANTIII